MGVTCDGLCRDDSHKDAVALGACLAEFLAVFEFAPSAFAVAFTVGFRVLGVCGLEFGKPGGKSASVQLFGVDVFEAFDDLEDDTCGFALVSAAGVGDRLEYPPDLRTGFGNARVGDVREGLRDLLAGGIDRSPFGIEDACAPCQGFFDAGFKEFAVFGDCAFEGGHRGGDVFFCDVFCELDGVFHDAAEFVVPQVLEIDCRDVFHDVILVLGVSDVSGGLAFRNLVALD